MNKSETHYALLGDQRDKFPVNESKSHVWADGSWRIIIYDNREGDYVCLPYGNYAVTIKPKERKKRPSPKGLD